MAKERSGIGLMAHALVGAAIVLGMVRVRPDLVGHALLLWAVWALWLSWAVGLIWEVALQPVTQLLVPRERRTPCVPDLWGAAAFVIGGTVAVLVLWFSGVFRAPR